jgi:Na+/melibiose symporter-like transporter
MQSNYILILYCCNNTINSIYNTIMHYFTVYTPKWYERILLNPHLYNLSQYIGINYKYYSYYD